MGNQFSSILPEHQEFIQRQHIFFVGSAPLSKTGHVNLSPKGYDSFRILSGQRVAYLDLAGSGNETSAHIIENGRVTIMFCAFEGAPSVLKLYGTGTVALPDTKQWNELYPLFNPLPGARQIIVVDVHMVQNSCGFAVPFMTYTSEREKLKEVSIQMGEEALKKYAYEKNLESIDGLPTAFAFNKSNIN
ncbi:pyridoxamine 5'-phosphate oxidase family protein [Paenibacillus sp. MZ03-122A]|uniref:pyridoxamine 5'-phosphate oxidase family protein n=1 Tax=Paenibacillus sp. MZ03-122A TaxID=2962033 RepID=UPI0020B839AB|nr:pyridoxamine 5'-phosphate oxidase family protein [Paenibacillus sp. MZ03-122A]MCP3780343.1 pyridoxamine 5'-phosphate oxidase family protein [Paenibacillus sp. MZ03-122A]